MQNSLELTARQPYQVQQYQRRPVQLMQPQQLPLTQLTPVFHRYPQHLNNVNPVFLNNYGLLVQNQSLHNGCFKFYVYNVNIGYFKQIFQVVDLQNFTRISSTLKNLICSCKPAFFKLKICIKTFRCIMSSYILSF